MHCIARRQTSHFLYTNGKAHNEMKSQPQLNIIPKVDHAAMGIEWAHTQSKLHYPAIRVISARTVHHCIHNMHASTPATPIYVHAGLCYTFWCNDVVSGACIKSVANHMHTCQSVTSVFALPAMHKGTNEWCKKYWLFGNHTPKQPGHICTPTTMAEECVCIAYMHIYR